MVSHALLIICIQLAASGSVRVCLRDPGRQHLQCRMPVTAVQNCCMCCPLNMHAHTFFSVHKVQVLRNSSSL